MKVLLIAVAVLLVRQSGSAESPDISDYKEAAETVASGITDSATKNEEDLDRLSETVSTDPGELITKDMVQEMVQHSSFKPQKAGTRTISLHSSNGLNKSFDQNPSGWVMTETVSGPANRQPQTTDEKVPVYTYPNGLGPALLNGCTEESYPAGSPCSSSKFPGRGKAICPRLLDGAAYIGVGFDGRGLYKIESRRASLVQRYCGNFASFQGKDVPDTMNVFGIFETTAETKSFQSGGEYMSYIREKAGLSEQRNLFLSESTKHSGSTSFSFNLGTIGSIVGAAVGAYAGGPAGAQIGAGLGGAIGKSISFSKGKGTGKSESEDKGESSSRGTQSGSASSQQSSSSSFFAMMYVSIIMYEITLDEVKPQDLNLAGLKDYMSLPESYYSVGADVKYQNFLLRWGTHFIRSGKFGGQFKITKTANSDKVKSVQEFSGIAETEFQSMFSTLTSKYSQDQTSGGFGGFGGKKTSADQESKAKVDSKYTGKLSEKQTLSQSFRQSEFTHTTVEAQGGTPEIAEALIDFYTPAFKQLYHKWIVSIPDYVKPFEFQLKSIDQLFNMNMEDLFPTGNVDFGCMGTAESKVKILVEPGTNRRYYLNNQTLFNDSNTRNITTKTYCRYSTLEDFKNSLGRRMMSLEKAVAVYMAEGPFPTSTHELQAGQPGCEEATLAEINLISRKSQLLTFAELHKAPFIIAFDLPQEIPNMLKQQAKYTVLYRGDRWFSTEAGSRLLHLYDGCKLAGYAPAATKICFKNIILTYEEKTGFFHINDEDFFASKNRNPILPNWLSGSIVARASRLAVSDGSKADGASIPCNIKWLNSHRLDPSKEENCIHFTAASAGDIFVTFASIPRDHSTWYYLQINMEGVAFYKGMELQKRDYQKGMGTLGDKNLYQSYFVCVNQANGSVLMQFGKADSDSDVGTVYSGYKFMQDSQYSRLSFYTFGAGSKAVSLMDIRLTKMMPKVQCLNTNYILKNGHCLLDCHRECIECNLVRDDTACFHCRNVRVESRYSAGSINRKIVQCVPECPRGQELTDKSEKLCVLCRVGYFKGSVGNGNCSACAPGTFSNATGATECKRCRPGTFTAKSGSIGCQKCVEGTSTSSNGSTSCPACRPGSFSLTGQSECTLCPVGQFSDTAGQSRCQPCKAGYFTKSPGQALCTQCPAGTSSANGSTTCANNCEPGMFSPSHGVACKMCSAGTFSSSSGSKTCTPCPAGSFSNITGSTTCSTCPIWRFSSTPGSATCSPCPAGSFSNTTGSTECIPCPSRHFKFSNADGTYVCSNA